MKNNSINLIATDLVIIIDITLAIYIYIYMIFSDYEFNRITQFIHLIGVIALFFMFRNNLVSKKNKKSYKKEGVELIIALDKLEELIPRSIGGMY